MTVVINKHTVKEYIVTRFTDLIPSMEEIKREKAKLNPFPPLRKMNWRQWQFFIIGYLTWTWDALDYFSVSLNVTNLSEDLHRTPTDITWGITLVLMLRSIGAIIFGYLGDRYGRKYPLCVNMALLIVLQIGCGFVQTYKQFLGVRAIFGIAMGAVYGLASATSLEDAPAEARSVLSGIFQQGYAFGYLLAIVFQRAITDNSPHGWRALFWFSAGPPVLIIGWRLLLPETDEFMQQKLHMDREKSQFFKDAKVALKKYWLMLIYLVLLMAGFNFSSHGSQDLYPTLLTKQLKFGDNRSTVTNCVANFGAICGGILFGHFSGIIGRRTAIIICCIGGGGVIYPWAFVRGSSINAGAFFMQFFCQGGWGVVPLHLSELSPPEFRAFVVGVSYQLGNLASSASSTIESTIGERFPIRDANGNIETGVYDYAKTMAIFMGCVYGYLLLITLIGPERRGANINFVLDENEIEELEQQGKIVTATNRGHDDQINLEYISDKPDVFYKERV